jgi:hypothetical protein
MGVNWACPVLTFALGGGIICIAHGNYRFHILPLPAVTATMARNESGAWEF